MKNIFVLVIFLGELFLALNGALADYEVPNPAYAAPATYYNSATGTGSVLKNNLKTIITTGFVSRTYGQIRYDFAVLDQDPNNPSNILLVYNRASVSGTWDGGATYNREHLWCCSWAGSDTPSNSYSGVLSDYFELRPCDSGINSSRNNNYFATDTSSGSYLRSGDSWYPGDADAGEIARSMFYMATRWADSGLNLVELTGIPSYGSMQGGDLSSLLRWHYKHGVDNFERRRNDLIYDNYQHNRNPYIDHPEYVWTIFGGGNNNSRIYVGSTNPSDGTSSLNVSLGRVMKNGTIGTTTVTMNKTGANPTTFDITTSGTATLGTSSSYLPAGVGQCMDYNTQTKQLLVGLSASTSTTGLKTGSIVIDNTDLSSGGAGMGSVDGNDTVNVTAAVLDKRNVTPNSLNVNFNRVIVGTNVSQSVNLTTTGDDNNFTRVNVALTASVDANGIGVTGSGQLFDSASATGTRTFAGAFNSSGTKTGNFTLPVTTAENGGAGLTGEGSYNPLGTFAYSATALDHAAPSFSGSTQNTTVTIDFGIVEAATGLHSQPFNIFNYATNPTYTAALDLDSIGGSGSTGTLTTNLAVFSNLAAGSNRSYSCFFDSVNTGTFSASYNLGLSDENLPGANTAGSRLMTLTVLGRALTRQWIHSGDGNWSNAANWVGTVPGGVGSAANFKTEITHSANVILDGNRTVGSVTFDSPFSYTITGADVLTLHKSVGSSSIDVLQGTHGILTPIVLADNLEIDVAAQAAVSLTGSVSSSAPRSIVKNGLGILNLEDLAHLEPGSQITVSGGILNLGYTPLSGGISDVSIDNESTLVIMAGNHSITSISGTGLTQILGNSQLTLSNIIQNTLSIGGEANATAHGELLNSVPEPSTLVMFFGALGILMILNKRKGKYQA